MRKYDRNAAFNIVLKTLLFIVVFALCFCLLVFAAGLDQLIAAVISVIPAVALVLFFSFLLRFTGFYFGYYSFVSAFVHTSKTGSVYCPCCGKHFEQFKDERFYDDSNRFNPEMFSRSRQDVICDFCRSAPRHRILAEWAEQNISILRDSEILCFAPELSMMLWFRKNNIRVKTADLFDRRADVRLDITSLDLPDDSVDIVFCNHVLEHVSDYNAALSELRRIIRREGMLIISFPIDNDSEHVREAESGHAQERIRLFGQNDHLRVFGRDSRKMLEDAGFKTDTINVADMPENIVPVSGPADYDTNEIFVCVKQ